MDPDQLAFEKSQLIWILTVLERRYRILTSNTTNMHPALMWSYMGLDARKPVFGGLRTTKVQTSLHIGLVGSAPLLFAY